MNSYEDDQSEDGELAQSPVQDEMDFSLSDEDRDNAADSLVIKPPQAVVKLSHRDRRAHKKSTKDRMKDPRKEKKHVHRDRDKRDGKMPERDDAYREKQFYRDRDLYREKEFRDSELKERESYRDRDPREKEMYRDIREKDAYNRVREVQDKDMTREITRDRDLPRERDMYKEREAYKDKDYSRGEREAYRDSELYREPPRQRDAYKDKDPHKEKEMNRSREAYLAHNMQSRYVEADRKYRKEPEQMRLEPQSRFPAEDSNPANNEKENRAKTSGDKELEDLRSRLLSKRIGKDLQSQSDERSALDKHQEERRKKLLEAEREMEKRKQESRNELEARRQERRRRVKKRSHSPDESQEKKSKPLPVHENVVMISDASDVDMKSDTASEPEEGEHSNSETEEESSSSETESNVDDSKTEEDDDSDKEDENEPEVKETPKLEEKAASKSKSPANSGRDSGHSAVSLELKRSLSRSKSRSRSRSHSFSPPPLGENGKTASDTPNESDEQVQRREIQISGLPPYFPALQGCRSVEEFQCLNRIEEGTYGVVYRARDKTSDEIVALKRLKMEKEKEGFPITSLREINTLLKMVVPTFNIGKKTVAAIEWYVCVWGRPMSSLVDFQSKQSGEDLSEGQHPNIVTCREIVVGSNMDKIFIVMDYVEHDLKSLMETMRNKKQVFLPGEVKCLMMQLLRAVHHLHDNWILHRDLKTSNLLLSHRGILKVGDFGLAREYGSPLRPYTPIVVTLWYRAPELLLCCKEYSTPIDVWSVGCIFAELVTMTALFPGKSEVDQLNRIFKDLGTPSESIWPGYNLLPAVQKMTFAEHPAGAMKQRIGSDLLSEMGHALLQGFLTYDPERRLTADTALEHAYFKEQPVAIDPSMFPTWPAKSEGSRRTAHSPRPPAGGAAYAQNNRGDSDDSLGFRVHASRSINVAPGFSLKF